MKEQIKIRKSWLINPETQVQPNKKIKQRFKDEDQDWNKYTGYVDENDLEELEQLEDDKED